VGWGGEDDMMTFKVEAAGLRSASMPYRSYHLWHHRPAPDPVQYSKTLGLLRSRVAAGGVAVLEMAAESFVGCGCKEKYL
jgi:hypothetical protein